MIENHLKPVFHSIGINFVGRNMAAGGTSSADEVALCANSYFGKDIDIISHDYTMTDARIVNKPLIFASRLALLSQNPPLSDDINDIPSRPAFLLTQWSRTSAVAFAYVELTDIPVVALNGDVNGVIKGKIPDSALLSTAEIEKLPPFLQNFKCDGAIEANEPCGKEKYSSTACRSRGHKAGWHPGNKASPNLYWVKVLSALLVLFSHTYHFFIGSRPDRVPSGRWFDRFDGNGN